MKNLGYFLRCVLVMTAVNIIVFPFSRQHWTIIIEQLFISYRIIHLIIIISIFFPLPFSYHYLIKFSRNTDIQLFNIDVIEKKNAKSVGNNIQNCTIIKIPVQGTFYKKIISLIKEWG